MALAQDLQRTFADPVHGELSQLHERAQPFLRTGGTALAVNPHGLVAAWRAWAPRGRERIVVPDPETARPGPTFLPELGWATLEELDGGWLVRPLDEPHDEVRATLDLRRSPARLHLTWRSGSWDRPIPPRFADVLRVLPASDRKGLTSDELIRRLPGNPGGRTNAHRLISLLRKELGGLVDATCYRLGDLVMDVLPLEGSSVTT
jgi:hypothetical protein